MAQITNITDVCTEIFAGGDAPKGNMSFEPTSEFDVPIYSNGEANNGLYGYTNYARVTQPSITISARGTIGYAAIRNEPFTPIVRLITLVPKSELINIRYLYYAVQNYHFSGSGTSIPQLTVPMLKGYNFPLPEMETQQVIADILDKVSDLIALRKQQLDKLDELVKARFVEMFGDPARNEKNWPIITLGELAEIRIGPFGTLLHKEDYIESGHALVNPSHIVDGKIVIDPQLTISNQKYEELFAYALQKGDIVLGRRGEMGRCAVVHEDGLLCGTGSMIIRPGEQMKPYFLQNILSSPGYKKIIEDKAVGVTMLNLNVPIVSALTVPLLPLDFQKQYVEFMQKIDTQRLTVQQGLDKLETMKKALMQKYFG